MIVAAKLSVFYNYKIHMEKPETGQKFTLIARTHCSLLETSAILFIFFFQFFCEDACSYKCLNEGYLQILNWQQGLQTVMSTGQSSLKFMKPDKEEATERVFRDV